jgi:hypothetical protein
VSRNLVRLNEMLSSVLLWPLRKKSLTRIILLVFLSGQFLRARLVLRNASDSIPKVNMIGRSIKSLFVSRREMA